MTRAAVAVGVTLVLAVVAASVVPVAAQVGAGASTVRRAALAAPSDHHTPWIADGTGGKVNKGREDDDDQQYPGKTTFKIDDHAPGATSNSFNIYAEGFSEDIRMHWNVVRMSAFEWSDCTSTDAAAFGIDRGNDDSGTATDESLLDAYKSVTYTEDGIFVQFYKKERLAGGPVNITVDDQIVSRVKNCLQNPADPGWYRLVGYINGSTEMDATTDYTIYGAARYVYVCDGCESRQDARDELGPPPTDCPATDTFRFDATEWTCRTEDGTYYTTGNPPDSGGSQSQATATPTPRATATRTPTPTATPTATTATDGDDRDTPTASRSTPTSTAARRQNRQTTTGGRPATSRRSATRTAGDRRGPVRSHTASAVPSTPTIAEGPGLGAVAALAGLVAAALLALRRN